MFKVLLADDDPFILEGLHYIVDWKSLGLEITAAVSNGKDAMDYISCHTVHILLTDIKMPGVDGISLIRWIRGKGYDIRCIILSGYDDYPYMKQALHLDIENYLIKSVNENELSRTLENIVEKLEQGSRNLLLPSENILKENVLLRWATGRITRRELEERMNFLELPVNGVYYQVCVLRVPDAADSNAALPVSENSYRFRDLDGDLVLIQSQEDPAGLEEAVKQLAGRFSSGALLSGLLTVGKAVKGSGNVNDSYRTAKQLQNYSLMSPDCHMISYGIPRPEHEKCSAPPSSDMEIYYQALLQNDPGKAEKILEQIYGRDYDYRAYSYDYLQAATLRIFFSLADAARYLHLDTLDLLLPTDLLYKKAASFRSRPALYRWISDTTSEFFRLKNSCKGAGSPVIERMHNYAEAHYKEDISLQTISFEFNANAAYLGRIFKEATGQSFSSYLNQVRIKKAKMLLNETGCTVHEIAERIGYNSTNYFVNVFKKYTGCFPSQYREMHNS